MVERNPDLPCRSEFILRQGLQRRIRITMVHEVCDELGWSDVRELVVGRIRNTAECDDDENDMSVVSLGLFPGNFFYFLHPPKFVFEVHFSLFCVDANVFTSNVDELCWFEGENLELPGDSRAFYRFEAAWDSSLHNSVLLNRVTPSSEHIYLTMSAYVQLENCEQLSVITKDLCVTILGRDARTGTRSLKVWHVDSITFVLIKRNSSILTCWSSLQSSLRLIAIKKWLDWIIKLIGLWIDPLHPIIHPNASSDPSKTFEMFVFSISSGVLTAMRNRTECQASTKCCCGAPLMEEVRVSSAGCDAFWTRAPPTSAVRRTSTDGGPAETRWFSTTSGPLSHVVQNSDLTRDSSINYQNHWPISTWIECRELEKLARLEAVSRTRYWMLLRERLGLDKTSAASLGVSSSSSLSVVTKTGRPHGQDFTKSEKEMCNMMAKASNDGNKSTPSTPPPHINRYLESVSI